jgi:hypothetical protein
LMSLSIRQPKRSQVKPRVAYQKLHYTPLNNNITSGFARRFNKFSRWSAGGGGTTLATIIRSPPPTNISEFVSDQGGLFSFRDQGKCMREFGDPNIDATRDADATRASPHTQSRRPCATRAHGIRAGAAAATTCAPPARLHDGARTAARPAQRDAPPPAVAGQAVCAGLPRGNTRRDVRVAIVAHQRTRRRLHRA